MSDDSDSSEYDSDSDELNTIGDGVRFRVFFFFEFCQSEEYGQLLKKVNS